MEQLLKIRDPSKMPIITPKEYRPSISLHFEMRPNSVSDLGIESIDVSALSMGKKFTWWPVLSTRRTKRTLIFMEIVSCLLGRIILWRDIVLEVLRDLGRQLSLVAMSGYSRTRYRMRGVVLGNISMDHPEPNCSLTEIGK